MTSSLTGRLALAMAAVAAVSALLAGLLLTPLLAGSREAAVREPLARQVELLARLPPGALTPRRVDRVEGVSGLTLGSVTADGAAQGAALALDADELTRLVAGTPVSSSGELAGRPVLLEARAARAGGGVVLAADAANADGSLIAVRRRVLLALALGCAVALGLAVLLATRLARPLTRAADAARRLAAGERGVELPPTGTREIADVTAALGQLDEALHASEGRQRRFLLSVSHELRTPLTAIRGYAEGLADGTVPTAEAADVGSILVAESQRLEAYLADLLSLARLEADDFLVQVAPVDVASLVGVTARAWSGRCVDAGLRLTTDVSSGLDAAMALADPARLRQVLDALLDNAVRVTPTGGVVVLAARIEAQSVVVEVRDSGPGLAVEDVAVAFEPGVLHERYRGRRPGSHGLGLAIVGRLVARMGGQVSAGPAPEGGASFVVSLPRG